MMELWDAYDGEFQKIDGLVLERGKPVPEGVYHLVCEIIVRHTDGTYLLMRRDPRKHLGGKWELTAGGSALKGENAWECASRELREETGIEAKDLTELGKTVHEDHRTVYAEYLCVTDCEKESIILQKEETIAYKWISKEELCNMNVSELAATRTLRFI
ncbi:MAG: NUDIX domain-containing protein [Blautia sp.]|nr:NUDIX domain-containing protein [Blautia sp.]